MKDRSESGRGRPYSPEVLIKIKALEDKMLAERQRINQFRQGTAEILWFCRETRQTMILEYPLRYTPMQAIDLMNQRDIAHQHFAWETIKLE